MHCRPILWLPQSIMDSLRHSRHIHTHTRAVTANCATHYWGSSPKRCQGSVEQYLLLKLIPFMLPKLKVDYKICWLPSLSVSFISSLTSFCRGIEKWVKVSEGHYIFQSFTHPFQIQDRFPYQFGSSRSRGGDSCLFFSSLFKDTRYTVKRTFSFLLGHGPIA